ncbi:MAG: DUF6232 family protein, partial [Prochlorothrix sp.]
MAETLLYRKRGIRLTTETLEIRGGGVYPLQSIRGVTVREERPDRKGPILCLVLGVMVWPLIPIGVIWLLRQRSAYWLSLETEYGTVEPLGMAKPQIVQELQGAIAEALEARSLPQKSQSRLDRLRQTLLEVAQRKGGEISVTDGVLATGCGFEEVKGLLDAMLASGYVQLDNHWETGVVIYRFPELLTEASVRSPEGSQPSPEALRQDLLKAAQASGGRLSITQGVLATGQSFGIVQDVLGEMLGSGYVKLMEEEGGGKVYVFPELGAIADRPPLGRGQGEQGQLADPRGA